MSTLSIPVSDQTRIQMQHLIDTGMESNIADIGRKAIRKYLEDQAVQMVLDAHKEPTLYGDLDELAKKI